MTPSTLFLLIGSVIVYPFPISWCVYTLFKEKNTFFIICISFGIAFLSFFLISIFLITNKNSCLISYKNGVVSRKGLFFGFRLDIEIKDIVSIDCVSFVQPRGIYKDYFYAIIDNKHSTKSIYKQDSTIFIPKNEKGVEFIKLFIDERIETSCVELRNL